MPFFKRERIWILSIKTKLLQYADHFVLYAENDNLDVCESFKKVVIGLSLS